MYEYGMYNSNDEKRKERFHALLSLPDSHAIDNSRAMSNLSQMSCKFPAWQAKALKIRPQSKRQPHHRKARVERPAIRHANCGDLICLSILRRP